MSISICTKKKKSIPTSQNQDQTFSPIQSHKNHNSAIRTKKVFINLTIPGRGSWQCLVGKQECLRMLPTQRRRRRGSPWAPPFLETTGPSFAGPPPIGCRTAPAPAARIGYLRLRRCPFLVFVWSVSYLFHFLVSGVELRFLGMGIPLDK